MKYPGRKFWLSVLVVLCASGLVYVGSITPEAWAAVVGTTVVAYIGGNVAQKKVEQ